MTAPGRSSQPQPSSRVTRNEPTSAVGVRREASDKTRLSDISFPLPDAALPFTFLRWTALRPRRTVRFSPARSLPANDGLLARISHTELGDCTWRGKPMLIEKVSQCP